MNRSLILAICLTAGAARAQDSADAPRAASAPAKQARPLALWIQPVSSFVIPIGFFANDKDTFISVPLGMDVALSPTQYLVLELTPIFTWQDCEGPCSSSALFLSVGTAWTPSPVSEGTGFFIAPKLGGLISRDVGYTDFYGPPTTTQVWSKVGGQLSLGLDVGYRLISGRFYLAAVTGGSVGWGWNIQEGNGSAFLSLLGWPSRLRDNRWVWDINLNSLRAGMTF